MAASTEEPRPRSRGRLDQSLASLYPLALTVANAVSAWIAYRLDRLTLGAVLAVATLVVVVSAISQFRGDQ